MSSTSLSAHEPVTEPGRFASICCGVDGTRAGFEAVRQAAVLAQPDHEIRLLAVTWETGSSADAMLRLSRRRAEAALERARAIVSELGGRAAGTVVEGPHAEAKLLEAAAAHDLLVVGGSGRSRAGGLVLGHAADDVLRGAPTSVLVARESRTAFPASILLVAADAAAIREAAPVAGALARRHRSEAAVIAARMAPYALAEAITTLYEATGTEPVVLGAHGKLVTTAAHAATDLGASLVVTAGRDAEEVAEHVRCSVLLVRNPPI